MGDIRHTSAMQSTVPLGSAGSGAGVRPARRTKANGAELVRSAPAVVRAADELTDADRFCERVAGHPLFASGAPIAVARAPGRLDVLGGIADYSGSAVLTLPLGSGVLVAAQPADDGRVVAVSDGRRVALDADELWALPPDQLARRLEGPVPNAWAAYVLGPVVLLAREGSVPVRGLRLLISSSLPEGKGLGSSAAVEVAVLQAVAACLGVALDPQRLALLAQRAEHVVAGAPCGSMDQMTAACGIAGELLLMLCRPAEILRSVPLPSPLRAWGIDSGIRHSVAGAAYRRVRCASFMGKALLGVAGYLTELYPESVDPQLLPEWMSGADFLRMARGVDDPVSVVDPETLYPVRAATLYPLEEHRRVRRFAELLARPVDRARAELLDALMYASHLGYSRCGLGTPATDAIVDEVRAAGWSQGLVGARVSGGGSGGAVVVLGREDAEPVVQEIAGRLGAGLVGGSSAGAATFGIRML